MILLAISICVVVIGNAQEHRMAARNTLFAEGSVKGALYSLNYDRVFKQKPGLSWSYRIGFSVLKDAVAMPIGVTAFTGTGIHHLEYSLTAVPYIEAYQELFTGNNISDKKLFILPAVGYRYQKLTGGLFARVAVGPVIYLDPASDNFWHMEGKVYPGVTAGLGISF